MKYKSLHHEDVDWLTIINKPIARIYHIEYAFTDSLF